VISSVASDLKKEVFLIQQGSRRTVSKSIKLHLLVRDYLHGNTTGSLNGIAFKDRQQATANTLLLQLKGSTVKHVLARCADNCVGV